MFSNTKITGGSGGPMSMFDIHMENVVTEMHGLFFLQISQVSMRLVYEQFKQRMFESLDYRKRDAAISLHKLFRFIEKAVRVLGKSTLMLKGFLQRLIEFRRRQCSLSMFGCVQSAERLHRKAK